MRNTEHFEEGGDTAQRPDVSIVIACYNEAGHLMDNVREIRKTMDLTRYSFEIIFVDDCSQDDTREIITGLCREMPGTRYIFHEKNTGRGGAVKTGLRIARGKIAGFLDIDLETHCRYIPSMVEAIEKGADLACGYRIYRIPFALDDAIRDILSTSYRMLVRMMLGVSTRDTEAGYKFFNMRTAAPLFELSQDPGWFWDTEIIALAERRGFKIAEVPMVYLRRADKLSTVKPIRDSFAYMRSLRKFRKQFAVSLPYRSSWLYHRAMNFIYRSNHAERYRAISDRIPEGASVVDVCCGDAELYINYLKHKNIKYTGLDINRAFASHAASAGADVRILDIETCREIPRADYVVMQSSLYQFMPHHDAILEKLERAAGKAVVITEPVSNWSSSGNPLLSMIGKKMTNPGTGPRVMRFSGEELERTLARFSIKEHVSICGGRELLYVIDAAEKA